MAINQYNLDGWAVGSLADLGITGVEDLSGTAVDLSTWDSKSFQWQDDTNAYGAGTQVQDLDLDGEADHGTNAVPSANEGVLVNGSLVQVRSYYQFLNSTFTMDDGTVYSFRVVGAELTNGEIILILPDSNKNILIDGGFMRDQIASINLSTAQATRTVAATGFDGAFPVCFTSHTLIDTLEGPVCAKDIKVGDKVRTYDNGLQPVVWIGSRSYTAEQLDANPKLRPVRIRAGALGSGLPTKDLIVSPQHRMLVNSRVIERMFDNKEMLIPAKKLVGLEGVEFVVDDEDFEAWNTSTFYAHSTRSFSQKVRQAKRFTQVARPSSRSASKHNKKSLRYSPN